jgi:hypothetical protein
MALYHRSVTNCEIELKNISMRGEKVAAFVDMSEAKNTCNLQDSVMEEWKDAIKQEVKAFYESSIYQYSKMTVGLSLVADKASCNYLLDVEYLRYCEAGNRIVDVTLLKMTSKDGSRVVATDTIKREKVPWPDGNHRTVRCFLNDVEVVEGSDGKSLYRVDHVSSR